MNQLEDDLKEITAKLLEVSVEEMDFYLAARRAKYEQRAARVNAKYRAAAARITPIQEAVVDRMVSQGWNLCERMWQHPRSGNVARMMTKACWDGRKGKISNQLSMVYPDGSVAKTFEKTISIKQEF